MAPLKRQGEVCGVLLAARREPASFSSNDCEFLLQLSTHVSLARQHGELHASLRQAYDELRTAQQALVRQERLRALGQMASGIAHDIHNLVFPAVTFARGVLASEPSLSADGIQRLDNVVRALDEVTATIDRLREFYRPRETQRAMAPVELNALVRQVMALVGPRCDELKARGAPLATQIDLVDGVPPVMGDAAEIREALVNLVINALDAMPRGGTLRVRTRLAPSMADGASRTAAEVAVEDTGVGMSEETRRRCLDPFYTTKGDRVTDLGMPSVDGHAVARSVKERSPRTPVVLMTGWGEGWQRDDTGAAHIDALIAKPPSLVELKSLLSRLAGKEPKAATG